MNDEPTAEPIDPNDEPDIIKPSATGLLISGDDNGNGKDNDNGNGDDSVDGVDPGAATGAESESSGGSVAGSGVAHPTGQRQAEENAENDPPA